MYEFLITGAEGFIGKHLANLLKKKRIDFYSCSKVLGDISLNKTWENFPKAKIVVHLAGRADVLDSWQNPESFLDINFTSIILALEYCKKNNAKLIFLSTYMYGNTQNLPSNEDCEIEVLNPYALSKKLAEDTSLFYSKYFGISVIVFRVFNVYGLGQSQNFLIPYLAKQIKEGSKISLGNIDIKRDYIHVEDVCRAILLSANFSGQYEVVNIGSGKNIMISDLISLMQKIACTNLKIETSDYQRPNQILETLADITRAKEVLNWTPQISIEDGLKSILLTESINDL